MQIKVSVYFGKGKVMRGERMWKTYLSLFSPYYKNTSMNFLCKKFSLTHGLCQHSPNLKSVHSLQEQDIYALDSKEYWKQVF